MLTDLKLALLRGRAVDDIFAGLSDDDKKRLAGWGEPCGIGDLKTLCELAFRIEKGATDGIDRQLLDNSFFIFNTCYPKKPDGKRGAFIVIEGLDGSGKGTQFEKLSSRLKDYGRLYTTAEPTASTVGGLIRDALGGIAKKNSYELASLFLSDRISHCTNSANGIAKYLDNGVNVLCDRYYYSTFAYQGMECDMSWLIDAHYNCDGIIRPDLCIFLDVPPSACFERVSGDRLHIEIYEKASTLQKVRDKFAEAFERINGCENIVVINADRSIDEVFSDISRVVEQFMA